MRLAVIMALALATFAAAADSASARQRKQAFVGKGSTSLPKPTVRPNASKGQATKGIIMKDGSICNPRWGC
jgi:hypothetical protein